MTIFERLRYSLYLAAVGGAVFSLVIAIAAADVVGWLPPSGDDVIFSPYFPLALYLAAYLVTPSVSRRFPIVPRRPRTSPCGIDHRITLDVRDTNPGRNRTREIQHFPLPSKDLLLYRRVYISFWAAGLEQRLTPTRSFFGTKHQRRRLRKPTLEIKCSDML
jgi:hypothetical protein